MVERTVAKVSAARTRWLYAVLVAWLCGCGSDPVVGPGTGGGIYLSHTPAGTVDTMVTVPAGSFLMGNNLDAFYIDKYEVTNGRYRAFVEHTGHRQPTEADNPFFSGEQHPAIGVSWNDARAYCRWRGGALPSEAQWEKAARGTDGRTYPWGNAAANGDRAVMDLGGPCGRSSWEAPPTGPVPGEFCSTMPVGSKPRGGSPYGLMDMAGNVWEWCEDWYDDTYYRRNPTQNPRGPGEGEFRVVRGSSWHHLPHYLETSARFRFAPDNRSTYVGFRCVQEIHK
jgi:iron(II)-dependent oxidoreductase